VKLVCTRCERISEDGNLWCQEKDCPAGAKSVVFGYGDFLGDIQILRMVAVYRSSAIYEAQRGKTKVLLKVAHDGNQEQLKREAMLLGQLPPHPMLPVLLPPYEQADVKQRPYGKIAYQDQTKYYLVFQHAKGEFLRDLLIKNPQPWFQHAAWQIISLADALAFMHVKAGKLHLNISPDQILVRMDLDNIPRPLLLDLGMCADPTQIDPIWVQRAASPAYTPPELLDRSGQVTFTADVYGLGALLYEMLAGHPLHRFRLRSDDEVRASVIRGQVEPLNRTDLAQEIAAVVMQSVNRNPAQRFPDIRTFAKELRVRFGEVPAERKRPKVNRNVALLTVFGAAATVAIMVLASLVG
jgi:serine/threonine protein kinase